MDSIIKRYKVVSRAVCDHR